MESSAITATKTLDQLPWEILMKIFSYLPAHDLIRTIAPVNSELRQWAMKLCEKRRSLSIYIGHDAATVSELSPFTIDLYDQWDRDLRKQCENLELINPVLVDVHALAHDRIRIQPSVVFASDESLKNCITTIYRLFPNVTTLEVVQNVEKLAIFITPNRSSSSDRMKLVTNMLHKQMDITLREIYFVSYLLACKKSWSTRLVEIKLILSHGGSKHYSSTQREQIDQSLIRLFQLLSSDDNTKLNRLTVVLNDDIFLPPTFENPSEQFLCKHLEEINIYSGDRWYTIEDYLRKGVNLERRHTKLHKIGVATPCHSRVNGYFGLIQPAENLPIIQHLYHTVPYYVITKLDVSPNITVIRIPDACSFSIKHLANIFATQLPNLYYLRLVFDPALCNTKLEDKVKIVPGQSKILHPATSVQVLHFDLAFGDRMMKDDIETRYDRAIKYENKYDYTHQYDQHRTWEQFQLAKTFPCVRMLILTCEDFPLCNRDQPTTVFPLSTPVQHIKSCFEHCLTQLLRPLCGVSELKSVLFQYKQSKHTRLVPTILRDLTEYIAEWRLIENSDLTAADDQMRNTSSATEYYYYQWKMIRSEAYSHQNTVGSKCSSKWRHLMHCIRKKMSGDQLRYRLMSG